MVNKFIENFDKLNDKLKGRSKCSAFECAVLCRYLIKLIDNLYNCWTRFDIKK